MIIQSSYDRIQSLTTIRVGETKLGQVIPCLKLDIHFPQDLEAVLKNLKEKYVLLGISEDIGVRANCGRAGTRHAYSIFLQYFLNTQKNSTIDASKIFLLGEVFVEDLLKLSDSTEDIQTLRTLTADIDKRVSSVVEQIVKAGKIPILIGGGHNNSFGNIKGTSTALNRPIDVLNIDPHADFRIEEGRHSGNGFRYAYNQGFLSKYGVWGLHPAYNNSSIMEALGDEKTLRLKSFEEWLLGEGESLLDFLHFFGEEIGLEIDLDAIQDMPTSAITPLGFDAKDIYRFVHQIQSNKTILYYHFCEGAPTESTAYKVGKLLSYLVRGILLR